jgi:hypothetical protein
VDTSPAMVQSSLLAGQGPLAVFLALPHPPYVRPLLDATGECYGKASGSSEAWTRLTLGKAL